MKVKIYRQTKEEHTIMIVLWPDLYGRRWTCQYPGGHECYHYTFEQACHCVKQVLTDLGNSRVMSDVDLMQLQPVGAIQ